MMVRNTYFEISARELYLIGLFSVAGVFLVLLSAPFGGVGTTYDSVHYISASRSLINGEGYLRYNQVPLTSWPPLYPTIIAFITLITRPLGLDVAEALRYAHALLFGVVILLSGILFRQYIRSRWLFFFALAWVLLAFSLLRLALFVWSELIFIVISLGFFLILPAFLEKRRLRDLALLIILAALGSLQRFMGTGLVAAGGVVIFLLLRDVSLRQRIAYTALYGLSALPFALLFLNRSASSTPMRTQHDPLLGVIRNIERAGPLLGEWFLPPPLRIPLLTTLLTLALVLLMLGVAVRYFRHPRPFPAAIALYLAAYLTAFLSIHLFFRTNILDQRHFTVVYPFVILLIFYALDQTSERYRRLVLVGAAVWTLYAPFSMYAEVRYFANNCCDGELGRANTVIQWANTHPLDGQIFSNSKLALLHTPYRVYAVPATLRPWPRQLADGQPAYILWLDEHQLDTPIQYDLSELQTLGQLSVIAELEDGRIYQLQPAS